MYTYNPIRAIQKAMIRNSKKNFYLSQVQHLSKNPSQPVPNRAVSMEHKPKMGSM